MELNIHTHELHRLVALMTALSGTFPEFTKALTDVAGQAALGITIEINPLVAEQTTRQRGYYHKWKNQFAVFCGMTPDEMHEELLCQTYGSEACETRFGRRIRPNQRSSDANRIEYSSLIDTLIRVAAQMGFDVPPPVRKMDD